MKVLFLSMSNIVSLSERGIYTDLLREFVKNGHDVYVVTPAERRTAEKTRLYDDSGAHLLRVRTGDLQKTSFIRKGISTIRITGQFKRAIKKYFKGARFDFVLYSTPPITLDKVVAYIKKRDGAKTYLLLKDIFPQNAIDIGILSKKGLKGLIYRHFRKQEKNLYAISDKIGCMSKANVEFLLRNDPEIDPGKAECCPNSIEPQDVSLDEAGRAAMREKYGLPQDKTVFIYGGNLGKPQGIPFIIECLRSQKENEKAFFFIVGGGTEYGKLEQFTETEKPANVKLMKQLPREDFDAMLAACDVGLIFLDHRFTIPNYPSRLLSYMQAGLPVLACTDPNTDIGKDIVEGGFGWQCESDDAEAFGRAVEEAILSAAEKRGQAVSYLYEHFTVEESYSTISKVFL